MGFMICKECGYYYKLQPREHPDDFDRCDCGGKLKYKLIMDKDFTEKANNYTESYRNAPQYINKLTSIFVSMIIFGFVGVMILLFNFLPNLSRVFNNFSSNPNLHSFEALLVVLMSIIFAIGRIWWRQSRR